MKSIPLKTKQVKLGVVPTHLKFVGGLVPNEQGNLPRNDAGELKVVANLNTLTAQSAVPIQCVQIPYFAGLDDAAVKELVDGLKALNLEVHFILMVGGVDPMNPADGKQVVDLLAEGLTVARNHQIAHVGSTSLEAWLTPGSGEKTGSDLDAAIDQLAKVHAEAVGQASVDGSIVKAWHLEFLRSGEFQTFTNLEKVSRVIRAANESLGRAYFKALVDAAHCGDSDLSIDRNAELIADLAEANEMGVFHASAKTTRGCLSTDDGWVGALLAAAAQTDKLEYVVVELFHHQDDALVGLRELDPRHGVDTSDGRTYDEMVLEGLHGVARRINNLVARGILG